MKKDKLIAILNNFKKKRVLVLGDLMLDHYIYGDVNRISPEAPIPVLLKTKEEFTLGGAGNIASNLATLGAKVTIIGIVGDDFSGKIVIKLLKQNGVKTTYIHVDKFRPTTLKQRLVSKE